MQKKLIIYINNTFRQKLKSYFQHYSEFLTFIDRPSFDFAIGNLFVYFYAVILVILNVIRVFDNCFWGDEIFSINLAHENYFDLIKEASNDVHPPLYYLILRCFSLAFGFNPWLYHFVSVLPYIIVVFFSVFCLRNKIGNWALLIFLTIISLSENALVYNVEVRMYSLASAFVFFSFYSLQKILEYSKGYIWFIISSLAAAYTHYYALLSVSFFYLVIAIYCFHNKKWKEFLFVYISTVLIYIPWLAHFLSAYQRTSNGFWISEIPSIFESFLYFFGTSKSWYAVVMLVITTYPVLEYIVKNLYNRFSYFYDLFLKHKSNELIKLIISYCFLRYSAPNYLSNFVKHGLLAGIGTIIVAEIVCYIVRPLYILRYIYPVMAVIVLACCSNISRYRLFYYLSPVILIVTLLTYIPEYKSVYKSDKALFSQTQKTVKAINSYVKDNPVFLTDERHFAWNVLKYYFPTSKVELITNSKFNLNKKITYWLMWNNDLSSEELEILQQKGFVVKKLLDDSSINFYNFKFYKLDYIE